MRRLYRSRNIIFHYCTANFSVTRYYRVLHDISWILFARRHKSRSTST